MGIGAAKQVTLPMCAAISVSCRETLKSPRRWRRIAVFAKQANRSLRGVCRELFVPFPAAFCRCVFQGSGGVRLSQKQEKLPLFPCRGQLHSCCFGIVSSWLQDVSFGMSVFSSHGKLQHRRLSVPGCGWRNQRGSRGVKRADVPTQFPAPLGDALQKPTMLLFSRSGWRCCLHTLSCRLKFPLPKGLYSIFPPYFPSPKSLPGPSFATQGTSKLAPQGMVVERGVEENTRLQRIVISYQNIRKQH